MKVIKLTCLLLFFGTVSLAQTGNFRSITTGTWSTPAIWERDADQNGSYEESPATVAPNSLSDVILVQSGDAVTLTTNETINGTLTIESGGTLNISSAGAPADRLTVAASSVLNNFGTLTVAGGLPKRLRVHGSLNNSGTMNGFNSTKLFFEANSVYDHQFTTTAGAIPLATWNGSSTCLISGYTSNSATPSNLSQSFGNFTWNCSNQTSPIDLAGSLTTINGDLNLLNTGFVGVYLNQSGSNTTISVAGDLNVEEFFVVSESGSNNILDVAGSAFFDSNFPYLVLSGGSGDVTFNVAGDITMDNGGFVDMSLGGTGNSTVNISGNLTMANFSYISTGFGSGIYTINFNGSSEQVFTASLNEQFDGQDINILAGAIVSISNNNFLGTSGSLDLANTAELRVGSTAANGPVQTTGAAGNIRVTGGQTYNSGSTIVFNGGASQFIGSLYPNAVNTIIDNNSNGVSLASDVTLGGDLTLTSGNLTVGAHQLTLGGTLSATSTISVASTSDIVINGSGTIGTFPFTSATPILNNFTLNRSGDIMVFEDDVTIKGALALTQGDLNFSGQALSLEGTFSGSGNLLADNFSLLSITGSGAFGTLQFDPSGNNLGTLSINRSSSGTVDLQGTLTISSALTLTNGTFNNGASLFMGNAALLTKNSNATYSGDSPQTSGANLYNVIYTNAGQTTGSEIPLAAITDALGDITVQTSGPVVLDQNLTVNGNVSLQSGSLSIGSNTLTVLGNWVRDGGALASYSTPGKIIFNGTTIISGTGTPTFGNTQVTGTASMTFPAGNINFTNNIQIDAGATFDANGGTVLINGSADQDLGTGGASFNNITVNKSGGVVNLTSILNLEGTLEMQSATTFNSAGSLVIVSTSDGASGNGAIAELPSGASITGDVTVQRYISGEGRVWRYLSSPVTNATVADWQDDFPITGSFGDPSSIPGVPNPDPSLYYFNESLGGTFNDRYVAYPSSGMAAANPLVPGRGYVAFIREDVNPTTVTVSGPVNQGDVDLGVTYTPTSDPSDGYNLVGNPYPSTIDWDNNSAWTKVNIDGMIAVRDNPSGTFQYWNGSSGDSKGLIATGQSFWIRTNGSSPSLIAKEGVKAGSGKTGTFYRVQQQSEELSNELIISLTDGAKTDKAYVAIYPGSVEGFDHQYDALKLNNDIFDLSTFDSDSNRLAINYFPDFGCEKVLPIDISDADPGSYTLGFENLTSFDSKYTLTLVDHYTNTETSVTPATVYNFDIDSDPGSTGPERFVIVIDQDFINSSISVQHPEAVCSTGISQLSLDYSQPEVTYQVLIDGVPSGDEVMGTGSALNIDLDNSMLNSGSNAIEIQATYTGCSSKNLDGGPFTIEKNQVDQSYIVEASAATCMDANTTVNLSSSQSDVVYRLLVNNIQEGDDIIGDGNPLNFEISGVNLVSGTNDIIITANYDGCNAVQVGDPQQINKIQIDDQIAFNIASDVCGGDNAVATIKNSQDDIDYQLILNGELYGDVQTGNAGDLTFEINNSDLGPENNSIEFKAFTNTCSTNLTQVSTVNEIEISPTISEDNGTLVSNYSEGNQWYLNNIPIEGANGETFTPIESGTYKLEVQINGCSASISIEYSVEDVTGIADEFANGISVYPNPVKDKLTIEAKVGQIKLIEIFDAKGNKFFSKQVNAKIFEYNSRYLSNGIYFVRLTSQQNVVLQRFIKE